MIRRSISLSNQPLRLILAEILRIPADPQLDPHRDRFDHALPGWRSRVPIDELSKTSLPGWFFNAWCDAIRDLGFKVSGQMPQITDGKGRTIYRMVFLSRHELPDRIWGDIARSPTLNLFDS